MILFSDQTNETISKTSSGEELEFPKLDREILDTNQDEVFEMFEEQNITELEEEITRRRKALQTRIKGTIFQDYKLLEILSS